MKTCRRSESSPSLQSGIANVAASSYCSSLRPQLAGRCWLRLRNARRNCCPCGSTGLQHFGMQVADVEVAGQFYGRPSSPTLTKEAEPPLRYDVRDRQ